MTYKDARDSCHVRSAIYRTDDQWKIFTQADMDAKSPALRGFFRVGQYIRKLYWKNHNISLDDRVPAEDKEEVDWWEYDPRGEPEASAFNEMPA